MGERKTLPKPATWKLADAKAELSRLVSLAEKQGPQRITRRGRDAVVVVSTAEYDRLTGGEDRQANWKFFSDSPLRHLKFRRISMRMPVREPEF